MLSTALRCPAAQIASSSAQSCLLKHFSPFPNRFQYLRDSFDILSGKRSISLNASDRTQGPSVGRKPAQSAHDPHRENSKVQQRTYSAQYGDRGNSSLYQRQKDPGFNNHSTTQRVNSENIDPQKNEVVLVGRVVGVPDSYVDDSHGAHMSFGLAVVNDQSKSANPPIPVEIIGPAALVAKEHVGRGVMVRLQGKIQHKDVEDPSGQPQRQLYVLANQCMALDAASAQRYEVETGHRRGSSELANMATLVGRAGMDPTVRTTNIGVDVCNFNIAVSTGESGEPPVWVRLEFWDKQAELAGNSVTKGALIEVSGRLRASAWNDAQGRARQQLSVVSRRFDVLKPAGQQRQGQSQGQGQWQGQGAFHRSQSTQAKLAVQQGAQAAARPTRYNDDELGGANF